MEGRGAEALEQENERLVKDNARLSSEMQTMKKKIMTHLKKQQADLDAKLKAAEERADTAEHSLRSLYKHNADLELSVRNLSQELDTEKHLHHTANVENQSLHAQLLQLKSLLDKNALEREASEKEFCYKHELAQQKLEELTRINQQLQSRLNDAEELASETAVRLSSTEGHMERISKEAAETKNAYSILSDQYKRLSTELQKAQETLVESKDQTRGIGKQAEDQEIGDINEQGKIVSMKADKSYWENDEVEQISVDFNNRLSSFERELGECMELEIEKLDSIDGGVFTAVDNLDSIVEALYKLTFQNEFLKSHIGFIQSQSGHQRKLVVNAFQSDILCTLQKQMGYLSKKLADSRLVQLSTQNNLKEKELLCLEQEKQIQDLSMALDKEKVQMELAITERDERYVELEAKLTRLQKRAKQRIQELQKEKEEIESQLSNANERAAKTMLENSTLQQELEKAQCHAEEALQTIKQEKQFLSSTTNTQKEQLNEMQKTLETKERRIEALEQSIIENDKLLENVKAQFADMTLEKTKAAEDIKKLLAETAEKEARIASLEASLTGEAARFGAALEAMKGELGWAKQEHQIEKENLESAIKTLKEKLDQSEKACSKNEIEFVKTQSQLESELYGIQQSHKNTEKELASAKAEIDRLRHEFKSYKSRAHVLLQKKDAELLAAKDTEYLAAQEAALKEAQRERALAHAERDHAIKALEHAVTDHKTELATRAVALIDADQRMKDLAMRFESMKSQFQSEREVWQNSLTNVNETWRVKYEALETQIHEKLTDDHDNELKALKDSYNRLKEENDSFRELANSMIEEKDKEISRLLDYNSKLQKSLHAMQQVDMKNGSTTETQKYEKADIVAAAEQQILTLARQQAQREEELTQCHRHIQALQEEMEELESENRLHRQQETMLKNELRDMERAQKRGNVDMTYLKNVILKLLETGEVEALLPVIGTLLQFSPDEIKRCQETYNVTPNIPAGGAAAPNDADAASSSLSFFPKFSLSL